MLSFLQASTSAMWCLSMKLILNMPNSGMKAVLQMPDLKSGSDFRYAGFKASQLISKAQALKAPNDFKYTTLDDEKTTPDQLVNK